MGDLCISLPAYFGLTGARAVKERGAFLVNYGAENYKIYKTSETPREIYARFKLLEQLDEAGFVFTDAIVPTAGGVPFVTLGRDTFVMTRFFCGREPHMNCTRDVKQLARTIAQFHLHARNAGKVDIPAAPPLGEVFAKQLAMLNNIMKQLGRSPRLSDFDVLVLKHAPAFAALGRGAIEMLAQTDYLKLHESAVNNGCVCHNALKEETFVVLGETEETCAITRFDEAVYDLQLSDLAAIIRRYARKSFHEISVSQFLEIYSQTVTLPDGCEKILRAQLAFPWAFLKIVTSFYSKKRNFIPASITTRMEEVLNEQERYDGYIKDM